MGKCSRNVRVAHKVGVKNRGNKGNLNRGVWGGFTKGPDVAKKIKRTSKSVPTCKSSAHNQKNKGGNL